MDKEINLQILQKHSNKKMSIKITEDDLISFKSFCNEETCYDDNNIAIWATVARDINDPDGVKSEEKYNALSKRNQP